MCRARAFADRFSILHAYGDVEAMLASPKVDVVYSATPHVIHAKAAIAALRAGKDVLVVKPLAMNPAEGTEVACVAAEEGPFAMEALWTRFLPVSDCVRQLLERGRLGVICPPFAQISASISPPDPAGRLFDPALCGGTPLDLGVYLATFACFVFGSAPPK